MHTKVVVIFFTKQRKARLLLSLKLKSKQSQFLWRCTQRVVIEFIQKKSKISSIESGKIFDVLVDFCA